MKLRYLTTDVKKKIDGEKKGESAGLRLINERGRQGVTCTNRRSEFRNGATPIRNGGGYGVPNSELTRPGQHGINDVGSINGFFLKQAAKFRKESDMCAELSNSAKRVQEYLSSRGFAFEVKELPDSTRTAQEAADSIGCDLGQIAKSLIFREKNTDQPILVIASGSNRVDVKKIRDKESLILGKADAKFVKERVGYAIGGIPPVGHNEPLVTLLDLDLQKHETIWSAAGTPFAVFQLKPGDLGPLTNGKWMELSE